MKTSISRPSHLLFCVVVSVCLSLLAVSCGTPSNSYPPPQTSPTPEPVAYYASSPSYITATSIQELASKSALVVIGQITGTGEVVNMAKDPTDPTKEDPEYFVVGQVYDVKVEQYLKGEGGNMIQVVQREGFIQKTSGIAVAPPDVEKAKKADKHIPMKTAIKYLIFLDQFDRLDKKKNYFVGVAQPWRFDMSDLKQVRPESVWEEASVFFPPQAFDDIATRVKHPDIPTVAPILPAPPSSYP